ncbi:Flavocytochrome c [Mycena amicta]|nr:Flavocytochrome c [Mycena amicta]
MALSQQTIVVGGGLAGLSAAHTLLERGKRVFLIDKQPALGGNSVKASSGINGAGTETQRALGIVDSVEAFAADTLASASAPLAKPTLIDTLTGNSASAIAWLTSQFGIDLSLVSRLGGHSAARTHRDTGGAPGWAITSALIKALPQEVEIVKNARAVRLLVSEDGEAVDGVEYSVDGVLTSVRGDAVILATGGYAADFSPTSLLATHRPDLLALATTNGPHATGDGIHLATAPSLPAHLRAGTTDLSLVQVHPTGFVDPKNPDAPTKFLAAEALRGVGGILLDAEGNRFVEEVERRDVVTRAMQEAEAKGPVRIVLGEKASKEVDKHCAFYVGKGLMKRYDNVRAFAEDTGIPLDALVETFKSFGGATDEQLHVAIITPVVHYTMGGLAVDASARVLSSTQEATPIPGLYAAGELIGGVHGQNRLAGSSLLEAVVFGRVAGAGAGVLVGDK